MMRNLTRHTLLLFALLTSLTRSQTVPVMTGVWTGVGEFPEEADLVLATPGIWFALEEDTDAAPGSLSVLVGAMKDPSSPENTCVTTAKDSSSSSSSTIGVSSAKADYTITMYDLDSSSSSVAPTINIDSPNCQLDMTVDPQTFWSSTIVNNPNNNTGCPSYFVGTAPFLPIPLTNFLPLVSPSSLSPSTQQGCVANTSQPATTPPNLPKQPPLSEWPTFSNQGQPPLLRGYFVTDQEDLAGVYLYSDTNFVEAEYMTESGTFTAFGRYLSYECLSTTRYKAMAQIAALPTITTAGNGTSTTDYFCEYGTWDEKSQMIELVYTYNLTRCLNDKDSDDNWERFSSKLVASLKAGSAMEECSASSDGGVKRGSGVIMMVAMGMMTAVFGF